MQQVRTLNQSCHVVYRPCQHVPRKIGCRRLEPLAAFEERMPVGSLDLQREGSQSFEHDVLEVQNCSWTPEYSSAPNRSAGGWRLVQSPPCCFHPCTTATTKKAHPSQFEAANANSAEGGEGKTKKVMGTNLSLERMFFSEKSHDKKSKNGLLILKSFGRTRFWT